jgi:hypothetical protein
MSPAVFEATTPAIEWPQTERPLTAVLYQCCCHYLLPMCQTSTVCFCLFIVRRITWPAFLYSNQQEALFYHDMAYYFSEHVCILFNTTRHFSEHFVLRSEAALYFSENVCVSINKIRYFCQHLLFHPDRTCHFNNNLFVSL